jgi:hypothetical protein
MDENQSPITDAAPAADAQPGLVDGDMGEMMASVLAKHLGAPDVVAVSEPVDETPAPVPAEAPKEAQPPAADAALQAKVNTLEALVQTLLAQRQAPAAPTTEPADPAPKRSEPEDPFERATLAGLRQELGTDDVPADVVEKYKRALSLRSLASSPGWDTPEVTAAIAAAEKDARTALDGYRQHGGLASRIAELEKQLKETREQATKPQAEAARIAAAEQEFSNYEQIPAEYAAMRKVAQAGGGKALGRAAAQVFGEKYGSVPAQDFARWLAAVEQQIAPVSKLADEQPQHREFMLTMLKSSNPALAEVMAPLLTAAAPAALPAKSRTVTPPTIPQSSGGGIPRPATQDGPLHQMETTAFDDLLIRKAREYGV